MKTPVREVIKIADNNHHDPGVVREPWRPGKEDHGDQLHARRQEIAKLGFRSCESHDSHVVTLCILCEFSRGVAAPVLATPEPGEGVLATI